MKTSGKAFTLSLVVIVVFVCISWMRNPDNNQNQKDIAAHDAGFFTGNLFANATGFNNNLNGDHDWIYDINNSKKIPPADDVMVQKIPGDNFHLVVMAVYTYAKFHEKFVAINNGGEEIVLRDDGTENDKVAGDGIYTTKIYTDVKEFRKLAVNMLKETIKNNWEPQFVDREFNYDKLCENNPFNEQEFDNAKAVSIANLADAATDLGKVRTNCIFLTDISVVEDPLRTWNCCNQTGNVDGAWTFKTLMKNLASTSPGSPASDQRLSDFVKKWLSSWSTRKIINGDTVAARTLVNDKILTPWLSKSLAAGNSSGFLDMHFAPFKLTAIVNRFDIRTRTLGIPNGEGRLVFCLINSDCKTAENFTVIFEYGIAKPDVCDTLRNWATQWFNLKNFVLGSPQYLSALQAITNQFTLSGTNPRKINQSSLDAVRTGEITLANTNPPRWEFREFSLNAAGDLVQRPVGQAPADKYNAQVDNEDVRRMVKFINENQDSINLELHRVPLTYDGFAFQAGKSTILDTPVGLPTKPYHWDGAGVKGSPTFITSAKIRHLFSRFICSGCHAGEMQTFFTHVDPVFFGTEATLSGFLTGTAGRGGAVDSDNDPNNEIFNVKDAANRTNIFRDFNDIKRRALDLKRIATTACSTVFSLRNELMFRPVGSVH